VEGLEVLDHRERLVVLMQEAAPLVIRRRRAESIDVVAERLPLDQKQETMGLFHAPQQLQAAKPRGASDKRLRHGKGSFEVCDFTGPDVEDGVFEDHGSIMPIPASAEQKPV
jgi:hypothetical protein